MTALEMPALRAAVKLPRRAARGEAGFGDLAADCAARLRTRLARPQRASGDWSVELPAGTCDCELCRTLLGFVLHKTEALFTREQDARSRDETDLDWLAAQ